MFICKYVVECGFVPLNPFNSLGYRMHDMVAHETLLNCDHNYIRICEEFWCFGKISDGVYREIKIAMSLNKPLRFFSSGCKNKDFTSTTIQQIEFESEDFINQDVQKIKECIIDYLKQF